MGCTYMCDVTWHWVQYVTFAEWDKCLKISCFLVSYTRGTDMVSVLCFNHPSTQPPYEDVVTPYIDLLCSNTDMDTFTLDLTESHACTWMPNPIACESVRAAEGHDKVPLLNDLGMSVIMVLLWIKLHQNQWRQIFLRGGWWEWAATQKDSMG